MSDSKDYIERLEALNRKPLENKPVSEPDREEIRRVIRKRTAQKKKENEPEQQERTLDPVLYRRDLPRAQKAVVRSSVPSGPPVVLEEAAAGTEVHVPERGRAYLVVKRVGEIEEIECPLCDLFREGLSLLDSRLPRLSAVHNLRDVAPHDVVFVDAETTGLGNSPLFLIGTMSWEDDGLIVRQYLARDYAEEAAVTSLFLNELEGKKLLVSFNGKSFDLPYIRARAAANAVPFRVRASHLDMLHECRRAWKSVLPNCKLQTLEKHICGRTRCGDIPGCEIPEAYHEYVRTSNAVQIVEILKHNMLDLVTLADLMIRLPSER